MQLQWLAVQELLDRSLQYLPTELERPQVLRYSLTDLPMLRLQVVPGQQVSASGLHSFLNTIVKRELEALPGIALVDAAGGATNYWQITPNQQMLLRYQLSPTDLAQAVQQHNLQLGNVQVKEGNYTYQVQVNMQLRTIKDLAAIPLA